MQKMVGNCRVLRRKDWDWAEGGGTASVFWWILRFFDLREILKLGHFVI